KGRCTLQPVEGVREVRRARVRPEPRGEETGDHGARHRSTAEVLFYATAKAEGRCDAECYGAEHAAENESGPIRAGLILGSKTAEYDPDAKHADLGDEHCSREPNFEARPLLIEPKEGSRPRLRGEYRWRDGMHRRCNGFFFAASVLRLLSTTLGRSRRRAVDLLVTIHRARERIRMPRRPDRKRCFGVSAATASTERRLLREGGFPM